MRKFVKKRSLEEILGIESVEIPYGKLRALFELPFEYLFQILSWEGVVPRINEDGRYVFDLLRREKKGFNPSITYGEAVDHFLNKKGKPSPTDYKATRILMYKIFKGRSQQRENS